MIADESEDEARVERVARAIESASDYVISRHYAKKVARAAIAAATAWLPIETAPKDGTKIMVFWNERVITYWAERIGFSGWQPPAMMTIRILAKGEWLQPTHWMPLPEPPKT